MSSSILTRGFGKASLVVSKHAPAVLTAIGVAAFTTSTALAVKESFTLTGEVYDDLLEISELKETPEPSEKEAQQELAARRAKTYGRFVLKVAKHYRPALIAGAIGTVSVVSAHRLSAKRIAGLTMAVAAADESLRKYKNAIEKAFGAEAVQEALSKSREAILSEAVKVDEDGNESVDDASVLDQYGMSQYAVVFDENASLWEPNEDFDIMMLNAQEKYLNNKLMCDGYVLLNDAYTTLGLPKTSAGAVVGWVYKGGEGDGYISFGDFESCNVRHYDAARGREVTDFFLDFNVDGVIWDKIDEVSVR